MPKDFGNKKNGTRERREWGAILRLQYGKTNIEMLTNTQSSPDGSGGGNLKNKWS
jgi:hypothetical protein